MVIVAGMAVQSLATNVDMAAFVKKDTYLTKYYELDFRIDDIEKSLDRLYKFTCTNVKSFGGNSSHNSKLTQPYHNTWSTVQTYPWYVPPTVDLSEQGYIRFNPMNVLNAFGNHSSTHKYVAEKPASMFKWRSGTELYPNTKLKFVCTVTSPNTTAIDQVQTFNYELIMGPFKKFPHITGSTAWNASTLCVGKEGFALPMNTNGANMYYAHGTDTEPTSWSSTMSGRLTYTMMTRTTTNLRPEFRQPAVTLDDVSEYYISDPQKVNSSAPLIFYATLPGTNLESLDKVWIRQQYSNTNDAQIDMSTLNLITWNNK